MRDHLLMHRAAVAYMTFARKSRMVLAMAALVMCGISVSSTAQAQVAEKVQRNPLVMRSAFSQPSPVVYADANQLGCAIESDGQTCTPGYWPAYVQNHYIFSGGIQVIGMIPSAPDCTRANRSARRSPSCFTWSGDTVAAFFFEGSGAFRVGTPITPMYDSRVAEDMSAWPDAGSIPDFPTVSALISDTAIYHSSLLGKKSISEQDTWSMYWDGNPGRGGTGRPHPLGITVEQRTHAWNYPFGNEATIHHVYKITNVTNNALFQTLNEGRYFGNADSLPNEGWRLDSLYVAFDTDADIGASSDDYATPILPFNTMVAYSGAFNDPNFSYPGEIFHAPFFGTAPGFAGFVLTRTPVNAAGQQFGITSFANHTNGGLFADPRNSPAAWRRVALRNNTALGDPACVIPDAETVQRRFCHLLQTKSDVRAIAASGAFSLEPGKSQTFVVAIFAAAAVQTPLITAAPIADNPPGMPSNSPGCNGEAIRAIDVAAGYLVPKQPCTGRALNARDIAVVPGSALGKALVAQSLVDNKFLMPTAPDDPEFALIPGDGRITVAWEPSRTEEAGDPFAPLAADINGGLFDPNFRKLDVEGYRIYRGTTPTDMKLIAQFDKKGTEFVDNLCVTDPKHVDGTPCTVGGVRIPVYGGFVQYKNITVLPNGTPHPLAADTAFAGIWLRDEGVPYGFVDTTVRNGFRYFYKVSAFDFNSIRSGRSTLESPGEVKSAIPRAASAAVTQSSVQGGLFGRMQLAPRAAPTIDPVTGIFSGPQLPTTGLSGSVFTFADQLLARGTSEIRIDSVVPAYYVGGTTATYYFTAGGKPVSLAIPNVVSGSVPYFNAEVTTLIMKADDATRAKLTARGIDAAETAGSVNASLNVDRLNWHSSFADWGYKQTSLFTADQSASLAGGSRWFDGANETMPDPTLGITAHGSLGGIVKIFQPVPFANLGIPSTDSTSTSLPPLASYRGTNGTLLSGDLFRRFSLMLAGVTRAADVKLYWGGVANGLIPTLDSVIDVTHDVPVQFSRATRATFGFVTDADGDGKLTYGDFYYLDGIPLTPAQETTPLALRRQPLEREAVLNSVDSNGDLAVDGLGFGLYINGEPYIFQGAPRPRAVWTLRTYSGTVTRNTQKVYTFSRTGVNPAVPGLRFAAIVNTPLTVVESKAVLADVHAVPDPYYARSEFDNGASGAREIQFVNMPPRALLRIFTLSGILVHTQKHDDATGGGRSTWDLMTPSGKPAASGVYYFHIATPDGRTSVGKFTVVNGS